MGETRDDLASGGSMRAGYATVAVDTADDAFAMAGYGPMASKGTVDPAAPPLMARALYLSKAGQQVAFCVVDMMSASTWVLHEAGARLDGIGEERLILAGTHTHTAPGRFYGNPFYDSFAHALASGGFSKDQAMRYVHAIVAAVTLAKSKAEPAVVGVGTAACWRASTNRSLEAFQAHADSAHWHEAGWPGADAPAGLEDRERAVDPRVTVVAAFPKAQPDLVLGAVATFACHATSMGVFPRTFERDWPGVAVDETKLAFAPGGGVAVGLSGAGDASPLPDAAYALLRDPPTRDDPREDIQGPALRNAVGSAVARAIEDAVGHARERASDDALSVRTALWTPPGKFAAGWVTMGGAEDARWAPARWGWRVFQEGFRQRRRDKGKPQWPKVRVRVLRLLGGLCKLSPYHRLHQVDVGTHTFATVPGEATAMFAAQLERHLAKVRGGDRTVSVLSYAGDYAGYFTTEPEYEKQHYEGASTLYGRHTFASVLACHASLEDAALVPKDAASRRDSTGPVEFELVEKSALSKAWQDTVAVLAEGPVVVGCADGFTTVGFTLTGAEADAIDWKDIRIESGDGVIAAAAPPGVMGHDVWLVPFETEVEPGEASRWTLFVGDAVGATLRPDPEP